MNTQNNQTRRALISVSDKTGLVSLAQALTKLSFEIISTGGTARVLREAGVPVRDITELTQFPEIMDGRVKTLHPSVYGGLLARTGIDETVTTEHDIEWIDLLVVNLYPFESTIAHPDCTIKQAIENIDIGGPALIRSAAKNHESVTIVTDAEDYSAVMEELTANDGATTLALRRKLAVIAYARTADYDAAIGRWFSGELGDALPRRVAISGTRVQTLRYGENPHQEAALYRTAEVRPGITTSHQLQGKQLSYNNLNDSDAAIELVAEFNRPAVVIVKHANPCGVAVASSLDEAYALALRCDPTSAFGGIIAVNRDLDGTTASAITELFAEVVVAPGFQPAAIDALAPKKNVRVLEIGALPDPTTPGMIMKPIAGGFLLQNRDAGRISASELKVVTRREPGDRELDDLLFAFTVCKHVKSNAIVYVKDGATVGVGAGQMSRVDSSRIAARKGFEAAEAAGLAKSLTEGSVVASDAFFPFRDNLDRAYRSGVKYVAQAGGSIQDKEVTAAADEYGMVMIHTGMRLFHH